MSLESDFSAEFILELNRTLNDALQSFNGRQLSEALIDEITEKFNAVAGQVYDRHGIPRIPVTRTFTNYLLQILIDNGSLIIADAEYAGLPSTYNHTQDYVASDPQAHDPRLLQDAEESEAPGFPVRELGNSWAFEASNDTNYTSVPDCGGPGCESEPIDFLDPTGSFDGKTWATSFKQEAELNPAIVNDLQVLTGWFANAIMTGYDIAKQEEHPVQEMSDEDYVFVEFYDLAGPGHPRNTVATLKFTTLDSAKTFVKLNGYGTNFDCRYVEFYRMVPSTTYKRVLID